MLRSARKVGAVPGVNLASAFEHAPVGMAPGSPAPLVLAFHGGLGTAKAMRRQSLLDRVADNLHDDLYAKAFVLVRLNFDLVTGFSVVPLQLFSLFGIGVSIVALASYVVVIAKRILTGEASSPRARMSSSSS